MIHDFATTPRTDWRADHKGVEFKSNDLPATKAPKSRSILVIILVASLVLLISQWLFQSGEPVLDQQPDEAAKKEYAESLLYKEENVQVDTLAAVEYKEIKEVVQSATVKQDVLAQTVIKPVIVTSEKKSIATPLDASIETAIVVDPDYEFYDFLKKDSWPIPVNKGVYVDGELATREKPVYKLQAASFRGKEDAYRLVAKLQKRKLRALVYESVSTSGEFWYQVSVGPFISTSKMNKAQDVLVSMSMMPLKKRVR